jgi:hypothetical protein
MKVRILFRYVLLLAVVIATFVSCNNDEYKTGADDVADTVKEGTWKVVYFFDSGEDKTQNYAGYNFTFSNNTVLLVSKDTNSYSGVWTVSKSTNDDDINSTFFMISFGSPDILIPLSGNWKVMENTGTSLKLKDDSKGELAVDYLTFDKN